MMKKIKISRGGQRGQAFLTAIIFLLILTFLGFALVTVATIDIHSSRNLRLAEEAFFAAEEGAMLGLSRAADISRPVAAGYAPGWAIYAAEGATVWFDSTASGSGKSQNDRSQFVVKLTKMGKTECGPGVTTSLMGVAKTTCIAVRSQSEGQVKGYGGAVIFSKSQVRARVEIWGSIRK